MPQHKECGKIKELSSVFLNQEIVQATTKKSIQA